MRIGIGLTTFNRPECLEECLEHIHKHTFMDNVTLYVATDTDQDRKGVAFRKNECLRALKDCDYVFLFDEDCYPVKDGWIEFFIEGCKYGYSHFLFMNPKQHRIQGRYNNRDVYNDCGGVFMFLTKKDIERVGAFNEKFETYGFEHAEYSQRVSPNCPYMMLVGTEEYLFAHDYSTPNHKSSITDEEKQKCIKNNWNKFFNSEIKDVYLPL